MRWKSYSLNRSSANYAEVLLSNIMNEEDIKQHNESEVVEVSDEVKKSDQDYLEGWKRCQADFQNYKRDEAKRMEEVIKYAHVGFASDIIEALDVFDLATKFVPPEISEKHKQWLDGFFYGVRQLEAQLKKNGLERIETSGAEFDPMMHEAVEGSVAPQDGEQIIGEQVRAGYTLNGRVIRPARVTLVKK